ncbi:MAG TPA: hypothetical protein VG962_11545 [Steroidobacteraceae bacterium]|nr:hypothetical protein [Steroidobacteraceae bacterium]
MKTNFLIVRVLPIALGFLSTLSLYAADIEPPHTQVIDKNGVNMANGQVSYSLNTVSIGGAMGLSHSVSVIANDFNFIHNKGFQDKYFGEARNVTLSTAVGFTPANVLRVYDFLGSADFGYYLNGVLQQSDACPSAGCAYVSMGDERQILEITSTASDVANGNTILSWTHPDGTVSRFSNGLLADVTYPNGFVIKIWAGGMGVTTNTGFQLKALYPPDNRPLDKKDVPKCMSVTATGASPTPCLRNAPDADSAGWARDNPKYIVGINNAYEYCIPTATDCSLTRSWPKATFNWPAGMPKTMFIGTTSMNVIDAKGQQTTFFFNTYDLAKLGSVVKEGYVANIEFSPRLVGVAPYGSTQVYTYDFKNVWSIPTCIDTRMTDVLVQSFGCWDYRLQNAGVVVSATKMGVTTGYDMNEPYYSDMMNTAPRGSTNGISQVQIHGHVSGTTGALYYVYTDDGTYTFEASPRNFVTQFDNNNGPSASYTYTRGNLSKISYYNGDTTIEANYPSSCDTTTRKTCNQATWIKDAKNNYTYYWYHAPSGQVASIKYPPNKHGVSPQVRYEYTQLSAHYYNGGSSKITGLPIWMKTAERTCINSSTTYDPSTGVGSCNNGNTDEVVTRYEYNNDNLLLTGMTVTAWDAAGGVFKTLRTCYQYDIYGNQIGKTQPNANLSSCN